MKKLIGAILIGIGSIMLYLFAVIGSLGVKEGSVFQPFASLGSNFPTDIFLLFASVGFFVWGILILFVRPGSRFVMSPSRYLFINSIILLICEIITFVGTKSDARSAVGVFFLIVCMQIVTGLILVLMSLKESNKSVPAFLFGGGMYVLGLIVVVLTVVWGI